MQAANSLKLEQQWQAELAEAKAMATNAQSFIADPRSKRATNEWTTFSQAAQAKRREEQLRVELAEAQSMCTVVANKTVDKAIQKMEAFTKLTATLDELATAEHRYVHCQQELSDMRIA